ncbi:MAG: hypothetical protein EHM52_00810 [Actinomycetota bacterium]|nr:MAG: hypothetical protein EHM52_00810 [Actinomycetota bacterium]
MAQKPFILPKDIPISEYPGPEVFLREGKRLVEEGEKRGIVMRVMGPLALHYYFPDQIDLYARLERLGERYFTDIDYAAYGKGRGKMRDFMKEMGYECDQETMVMSGRTRHIYYAGAVPMIDVFFDKLDYCHEVDYAGRLDKDPWSVPLSDILLQKLQIVEINDKDLKDIEYLFVTAELGSDDEHKINMDFIAKRFADDWGFWYTATQLNLPKVKEHCAQVPALTPEMCARIRAQADKLLARVEAEPKSRGWNKRAKKGASKTWYNEGFSDW